MNKPLLAPRSCLCGLFLCLILTPTLVPLARPALAADDAAEPGSRVFSDVPLLPGWVSWLSGSAELRIGSLTVEGSEFRDVRVPLRIDERVVYVEGATARFAGGSLSLDMQQDHERRRSVVSLRGEEIQAAAVPALATAVISAPFALQLELDGAGLSLHEIVSSADGSLLVDVGSGIIANVDLERAGQDLFALIVAGFNPFAERDAPARIGCARAKLNIVQGRAEAARMLGVQTAEFNIVCGGQLDFAREDLNLACRPQPRVGLTPDAPALVESIEIVGPFVAPELRVNKAGLLRQGASLGVGITKFRLSPITDLLGEGSAGPSRPCEFVFD